MRNGSQLESTRSPPLRGRRRAKPTTSGLSARRGCEIRFERCGDRVSQSRGPDSRRLAPVAIPSAMEIAERPSDTPARPHAARGGEGQGADGRGAGRATARAAGRDPGRRLLRLPVRARLRLAAPRTATSSSMLEGSRSSSTRSARRTSRAPTIDFLTGLQESGFKIENPNAVVVLRLRPLVPGGGGRGAPRGYPGRRLRLRLLALTRSSDPEATSGARADLEMRPRRCRRRRAVSYSGRLTCGRCIGCWSTARLRWQLSFRSGLRATARSTSRTSSTTRARRSTTTRSMDGFGLHMGFGYLVILARAHLPRDRRHRGHRQVAARASRSARSGCSFLQLLACLVRLRVAVRSASSTRSTRS